MTELFEPVDAQDWRLSARLAGDPGLLARFNQAGLLESGDLHVARRVGDLAGESDERVLLAVGLVVRAVRHGSVCVPLDRVAALAPDLPWPEPAGWVGAVEASPLLAAGVVRWERGLLYLDRYHRLETQVFADLVARAEQVPPVVDETRLRSYDQALDDLRGDPLSEEQRAAARAAVTRWTSVLTGGPGTGKTTIVARVLALAADQAATRGERSSVVLTAPTGKAAARLNEAVTAELALLPEADRVRLGRVEAMTLHRLLGWRADNSTRFRHDRANRLRHDLVVVDESSMVELTMMARLLEAVRPAARLVLVGDPRQLTSVGAGAVLFDVVAGFEARPDSPVEALTRNFRSTAHITALADALREGDAEGVLAELRRGTDEVVWVEAADPAAVLRDDVVAAALAVRRAAEQGDHVAALAALQDHRLLCAHREGPFGVRHWNRQVEEWLAEETGQGIYSPWYVGRPLLVTSNDYALEVYNGETGAVVARPSDGRMRAWIGGSDGLRDFAPGRLEAVETMHAMTIHKSQGSEAQRVTVLLPEVASRLLSRELLYTAVTRAQRQVRVVGSEEAVRAAVGQPAQRATGLRERIAEHRGPGAKQRGNIAGLG